MLSAVYASYIPPGQVDNGSYSYFPNPTAWNPGVNTARSGGFPAEGGATWSIMGAGLTDVFGDDSFSHAGAVTTDITSLGFSLVDIENMIGSSMDLWASISGFTNLGQVADGNAGFGALELNGGHLGDIRIGAISFGGPGGVLAHAYQPGTESLFGAGGSIAGDMHLDNQENWGDGTGGTYDLATVILHELGHALGLGHVDQPDAVMYAYYGGVKRTLSTDDINGIQSIYGAAVVPVPAAYILFLSGLGMLGVFSRRKRV